MRNLFSLLVVVFTLLCFQATHSLDFLDFGSKKSSAKGKGLRGGKEENEGTASETPAVEKGTATKSGEGEVAFLDVTVADEKQKLKAKSSAEASSAEGTVEEFKPEASQKRKGGHKKGEKKEEGEFLDLSADKTTPAADSKASPSTEKGDQKVEFVDVSAGDSTQTTTAQTDKKSGDKVDFVDLSAADAKSTSSNVDTKAKDASTATESGEKKVEFIDVSGSGAKKKEDSTTTPKTEQKVEFVDVSGSSTATPSAEQKETAAAATTTTTATPATSEKKKDDKVEFVDLSTEKKAESAPETKEKKVEFVDLNGEKKDNTASTTTTTGTTSSDSTATTAAAGPAKDEKKVEFVDLNANSEQKAATSNTPEAKTTEGKVEFVDLSDKNKESTSGTTEASTKAAADTAKDDKKVEFVDLNNTNNEKATAATPATEKKAEGSVDFLEVKDDTKKKAAATTTANDQVEMLDTTPSKAVSTPVEKKEEKKSSGGFLDFFTSSKKSKKATEPESTVATTSSGDAVLITGINTSIGAEVARQLIESGEAVKVYGLMRSETSVSPALTAAFGKKVSWVYGDLNDMLRMLDVMQEVKPTTVYHFAGHEDALSPTAASALTNPQTVLQQNLQGSLNLVEALRRASLTKTKIFYAGSSSEYGYSIDSIADCDPIAESTSLSPRSIYGLSKYSTELLLQQYAKNYGFPIYFSRYFSSIGPSVVNSRNELQDMMLKIVAIEQGVMKIDEIIEISPHLQVQRDLVDVRDAATAAIAIVGKGKSNDVYNIGSGEGITMKSFLGKLIAASKVEGKDLKIRVKKEEEESTEETSEKKKKMITSDLEKCAIADIARLKKATSFTPKYSLATTIEDTLTYLRTTLKKEGKSNE